MLLAPPKCLFGVTKRTKKTRSADSYVIHSVPIQDLSLDKLLDLIRQLREEIKTLQSGNDESCALASSRLLIIEEITAAKSILEGEKAALERSFLKEQEEVCITFF